MEGKQMLKGNHMFLSAKQKTGQQGEGGELPSLMDLNKMVPQG